MDETQGPGRISGNGTAEKEEEEEELLVILDQPGPQQTTEKFAVVKPQVKSKLETISSNETPFVSFTENLPPPPQQTTVLFDALIAQL